MKLSSSLFFAYKYLFSKTQDPIIKSMIRLCFVAIFLANFALALIISIMQGFEIATQSTLQTIYPHIIIDGKHNHINIEAFLKKTDALKIPYASCAPRSSAQMIISNPHEELNEVVQYKAIDPEKEISTTALQEKMIIPSKKLILHDNEILIGKELAASLHLNKGDSADLLFTDSAQASNSSSRLMNKKTRIAGIFFTGIYEYDNNMIIGAFPLFLDIYPDEGVQQIYMRLKSISDETKTIEKLTSAFPNAAVYTWKDLYPGLLASLKLETLGMSIILGLLFIIAIINMISLFFVFVKNKSRDIALLASFGMKPFQLRAIFIMISIFLSGTASFFGLASAGILGVLLKTYPIISLPEHIYYTNTLPIALNPLLFLIIFVCSISVGILATILPIYSIDQKNIKSTLHFDM